MPDTVQQFAARIKTKFPDYANVPDLELAQRIIAKHPEYKSQVQFGQPITDTSKITSNKPKSLAERVSQYMGNVGSDIRYGTTSTAPGRVLHKMGAEGTAMGQPPAVGEFMASPELGATRVVQGAAELAQKGKRWQGAKDVAGGLSQATEIPAAIVAGPSGEAAGEAITGAELIPRTARAGTKFQDVMAVAKNHPVDFSEPGNIALRAEQFAGRGANLPKVMRDFIRRTTDPDKGPLTYEEARDFYQNATRLSASEQQKMIPMMRKYVADFTSALNKSIEDTAETVGKGQKYQDAMREYHRASQLKRAGKSIGQAIKKTAPWVGAAAATGGAAGAAYKYMRQ